MEAPRPPGLRCFEGVHFALDLGPSMSLKEKTMVRELLELHGAIIDQVFGRQTDALVVTEERLRGHFQKVEKARKSFKPVVSVNYLVQNAEQGRCVDADVLTLDGFLVPANPKAQFSEYVSMSEAKVVPAINEAVSIIQAILASPQEVPLSLVDKLKRPVWMPHLSSLFARCVPDPRYVDYSLEEGSLGLPSLKGSGNVIEQIRSEREKKNLALMASRAEAKADNERKHFEKREARRALEVMAREEEVVFESQVEEQKEAIEEQMASSFNYFNYTSNAKKKKKKKKEKKPLDGNALDHLFEDVFDSETDSESDSESTRPKLMKTNPYYNLTVSAKSQLLSAATETDDESEEEKPQRRPLRPPRTEKRPRAPSNETDSEADSNGGSDGLYDSGAESLYSPSYGRRYQPVPVVPNLVAYFRDFDARIDKLIRATPEEFSAQLEASKALREAELKGDWTDGNEPDAAKAKAKGKPMTWGKPPKPPTDAGLKVFIGGIKYDDITKAATTEKWPADKIKLVKDARIKEIKRLCATFGAVKVWEEKWDEGFAFVTFEEKESAERMQRTLSQFEHRKGLCKQIRTRILAEKGEKLAVPSHSFYVRWPKYYQRIVENNKKKRAEEKAKEKELKESETAVTESEPWT